MDKSDGHRDTSLDEKTWRQLRQCTFLALDYLRRVSSLGDKGAGTIVAEMERILTEGADWPDRGAAENAL